MLAIGAFLAGCNQKSAPATNETPKTDSSAAAAETTSANPPATFHPGKMKSEKATASSNGRYVIQISVFKMKGQAESFAKKLSAQGFSAYVSEVENPTTHLSGDYYRVRIGAFATREEANSFAVENLKPKGFDYWVDTKSNDKVGAGASVTAPTVYKKPAIKQPVPVPPAAKAPVPVTPPAPARNVYRQPFTTPPTPRIYHPTPPTAAKDESVAVPPKNEPGIENPMTAPKESPAPEPVAPAPPAAPTSGDSMRNPFAEDAPAENTPPQPSTYTGDSTGTRTHRVLPTW